MEEVGEIMCIFHVVLPMLSTDEFKIIGLVARRGEKGGGREESVRWRAEGGMPELELLNVCG